MFDFAQAVFVVVPTGGDASRDAWNHVAALLDFERFELEVELGCTCEIVRRDPGRGARLVLSGDGVGAPTLSFDGTRALLVAEGRGPTGAVGALSLLRTMRIEGRQWLSGSPCATVDEAAVRLEDEIATTHPGHFVRQIDWRAICAERGPRVLRSPSLDAFRWWTAAVGDAHTTVHPTGGHGRTPYSARVVDGSVAFCHVPSGTPASDAGVRPGDVVVDVDVDAAWRTTGASQHMKPWLVAMRLLGGPVGQPRTLRVRRHDGTTAEFIETPVKSPWEDPVTWSRLPSGTGYVRVRGWPEGSSDAFDAAFTDLRACERVLVDLRGNVGGSLVEAVRFRARFLRTETTMGAIRFSVSEGVVSDPAPIVGTPSDSVRWLKRARLLTDPMTYSASEDAILGLEQFDHVDLVGQPTGGGSGRPRRVALLDDMYLTVTSALTFQRSGQCVEGRGVPVDATYTDEDVSVRPLPPLADREW